MKYNAPVVLTMTFASLLVLTLDSFLLPNLTSSFFTARGFNFPGMVTHVLGHANWNHFFGNFSFILLLGPILEEKYGSLQLLIMIVVIALITAFINAFLLTGLVGASGIVFMMILLASVDSRTKGIPITFLLVAVLFLGKEIINMLKVDNISQLGHLIGGLCGAVFGFMWRR